MLSLIYCTGIIIIVYNILTGGAACVAAGVGSDYTADSQQLRYHTVYTTH